jgi:hypothetical protein
MRDNLFPSRDLDLQQAYEELDHITKLLVQRDIMLTDSNLELETKTALWKRLAWKFCVTVITSPISWRIRRMPSG